MTQKETITGYLLEAQSYITRAQLDAHLEDYTELMDSLTRAYYAIRDLKEFLLDG